MMRNNNKGFIALISVVIISFVLLLVATTLGLKGFFSRFNILDSESKAKSSELANGCIETARLKLVNNNSYIGISNSIPIGTDTCGYKVESGGIIKAQACINKAATFYLVTVNTSQPTIPILTFKEDPILSTCPLVAF